jgi:hypothetical protein
MAYRIEKARCVSESPNAILIESPEYDGWIPQSQITADSEVWKEGQEGVCEITDWIAEQKGLL